MDQTRVGLMTEDENTTSYDDASNKLTSAIAEFEKQDKEFKEMYGFDPGLLCDFGVLFPEAVKNMLENRQMPRSESCDKEWKAIINCKSTPEERMRNFKKLIGDDE